MTLDFIRDDEDLKLTSRSVFADEGVDSDRESVVETELKRMVLVWHDDTCAPKAMAEKTVVAPPFPILGDKNICTLICCIMGYVGNGKTRLIDCISGGNVQGGNAGVHYQKIGATCTFVGEEIIRDRMKELIAIEKLNVPGLLLMDTPGHESFTTVRSRTLSLCDIAILVVDISCGLERETIELLKLFKRRDTKFLVALTKIDRLHGWKECPNQSIVKALEQQSKTVKFQFNRWLTELIRQFKEQGMNAELYYENNAMWETLNIVPMSATSGEGVADLLQLLVQLSQKTMAEKQSNQSKVQCTVSEVNAVEGHGTVIDVVLVDGVLREGDQIVVCGMKGPIITNIQALLVPHSMEELEVKGTYKLLKEVKAPKGMKIAAQGLEPAVAGTQLYVVGQDGDLEDIKEAATEDMRSVMNTIDRKGMGVYLQASTVGSVEALMGYLKSPSLSFPVCGIGIGPVRKKDVLEAAFFHENKRDYATILALDVRIMPEARELADELGVKIFSADIIDEIFCQLEQFINRHTPKEDVRHAIFPCVLKINYFPNEKDVGLVDLDVRLGIAKIGTPLCIPCKDFIYIGRIASIEVDHRPIDDAKKGQTAVIKIASDDPEVRLNLFESHLEIKDLLVSCVSRRSVDALIDHYMGSLSEDELRLVARLVYIFQMEY